MSNRLDDFIRNHREEFDADEPSPLVWNKIDQRLKGNEQKGKLVAFNWRRMMAAAAVLVILTVAAFYWMNNKQSKDPGIASNKPATQDAVNAEKELLNEINPAYAKEVYHFTQLIDIKQEELKQIEKENPQLYHQFLGEINKLDSSYNLLKKELPANPNREQLLEAMISNLQVQMDLLNQQLQIIQKIKQSKNKNNEVNSKTI